MQNHFRAKDCWSWFIAVRLNLVLNWMKLTLGRLSSSPFDVGRGFSDFNELLSLFVFSPRHRIFFYLKRDRIGKKNRDKERERKKLGGEAGSSHLDLSAPLFKASVSFNFSGKIQPPSTFWKHLWHGNMISSLWRLLERTAIFEIVAMLYQQYRVMPLLHFLKWCC